MPREVASYPKLSTRGGRVGNEPEMARNNIPHTPISPINHILLGLGIFLLKAESKPLCYKKREYFQEKNDKILTTTKIK